MSATIMMPVELDTAIKNMCNDTMAQTIATLATKYGFDVDEANRFMDTTPIKLVRKSGPSPKKGKEPKEPKEPKEKKSVTKKKDDGTDKPKRAKTGYLLFQSDVRPVIREELSENLEEDEKLKPQDVVKEIAIRWKALEQDERDEWNKKAKDMATSGSDDSKSDAEE